MSNCAVMESVDAFEGAAPPTVIVKIPSVVVLTGACAIGSTDVSG